MNRGKFVRAFREAIGNQSDIRDMFRPLDSQIHDEVYKVTCYPGYRHNMAEYSPMRLKGISFQQDRIYITTHDTQHPVLQVVLAPGEDEIEVAYYDNAAVVSVVIKGVKVEILWLDYLVDLKEMKMDYLCPKCATVSVVSLRKVLEIEINGLSEGGSSMDIGISCPKCSEVQNLRSII